MSGGFFRGTSTEQDTRFSNKQAKLLKSQKFAPELEHLVDMTKVKMDVMRPWIAKRVTELIGFEDEVLINFIYGLLDGKEVNGKEVQISLTGFMERNTGKFIRELWVLLLSAQNNASGVPQQFLDAKEEETKKKKAERDRIANEIKSGREKESLELEQEKNKKTDAGNNILKDIDDGMEPISKHQHRDSNTRIEEKEPKERNGSRGRIRVSKSPHSANRSSSPRGMQSRSNSKSFTSSRSYSDERQQSRSLSTSPKRKGRSSSSRRFRHTPPKRSLIPHRRHLPSHSLTPPRRRSSHLRRSQNTSPSPSRYRKRSPLHRGSRSPLWRRSRSPIWRRSRSPIRRSPWNRSRSPVRPKSSSSRWRSPSPVRQRSPSPVRYISRSPMRRRYQRSPTTSRRRSLSPIRRRPPMPSHRRSPAPIHQRSPSAQDWSSPSPVRHRSPSLIRRKSRRRQRRTPVRSSGERTRNCEHRSPLCHASPGARDEHTVDACKRSLERQSQSDSWERNDARRKVKELSLSPRRSLVSEGEREESLSDERRLSGPSGGPLNRNKPKRTHSHSPSPLRKPRENKFCNDSSETNADDKYANYSSESGKRKYESPIKNSKASDQQNNSHGKFHLDNDLSPGQRLIGHHPGRGHSNKKDEVLQREMDHLKKPVDQGTHMIKDVLLNERKGDLRVGEGRRTVEKNQPCLNEIKVTDRRLEALPSSYGSKQNDGSGSGSELSDKIQAKVREKRKNKRSERRGLDSEDESSYDSYEEKRKEAKRRRKEEKKLRKEERHRRREERRRKREARRTEKQKMKSVGTVSTPSDTEKYHDDHSDDDQCARRHLTRGSDAEENKSEQKKLEIELREKVLKSLSAKKGTGH